MVERDGLLSIRKQCALLGVSRSRLYYRPLINDESELANRISELYEGSGCRYGYRKIQAALLDQNILINKKKVQRIMGVLELKGLAPKRRLTGLATQTGHRIYPYLLDGLVITERDQVWATDITYIKIPGKFMYLIAIIDLYSRYVVTYGITHSLDKEFYVCVLQQALNKSRPQIFNSDQGCQFTSHDFVNLLLQNNIAISMDHKGRCFDNIYIERFWRTLKQEAIYYYRPETIDELVKCISSFIHWYNHERKHQALCYQTPAQRYEVNI
jgi:putative transposase